jgi:hypothetical protein
MRWATFAAALPILAGLSGNAISDEGGVSFWLPGQYASFAALPPETGFSMPLVTYYYAGDADANKAFGVGGNLQLGIDARYLGQFIIPTYAPYIEILGGRPSLSLATIVANSDVSADFTVGRVGAGASDNVGGFGDLYPTAQLFWNEGVHNWMAYVTGAIPVGSYEAGRLANIGIGHAAVDVGGAYTFLDPETGWELSATVGLTFNFENPDTEYTSGTSVHLDWAVSRFLSEHLHLGLVGFAYKQLSDDSGGLSDQLGGFRSETYGVGPQIGYTFDADGRPVYANLRGYWEFAVENRTKGGGAFLSLAVPL